MPPENLYPFSFAAATAAAGIEVEPVSSLLNRAAAVKAGPGITGVLILGGGVTGIAAAAAFCRAGYSAAILDQAAVSAAARSTGAEIYENYNPESGAAVPLRASFAVISPGIGPDRPIVKAVLAAKIPILTEIDLAFSVLGMPLAAVSGTNGKTTTTTIIDAMIKESGIECVLVGNVGTPPIQFIPPELLRDAGRAPDSAALERIAANPALIAELSSYQLEGSRPIRPRVGVWLNLDDNHLERHKTIDRYLAAKVRLFSYQNSADDFSVIGADDPRAPAVAAAAKGRLAIFGSSCKDSFEQAAAGKLPLGAQIGCTLSPDQSTAHLFRFDRDPPVREVYPLSGARLLGRHNRLNLAAAILAARLSGAVQGAIQKTIDSFEPIEHRIEIVPAAPGACALFINDSKSTTPLASAVALAAVQEKYRSQKIILLLGGQLKQGSWKPLADQLKRPEINSALLRIVIFGPDNRSIVERLRAEGCSAAGADGRTELTETIGPAIKRAGELSHELAGRLQLDGQRPKTVILLSPGCASFDEFTGYPARGNYFKQMAGALQSC